MADKCLVVYHLADFDGLFSAAVCLHWLRDVGGHSVTLAGWDFGHPQVTVPDGTTTVYIVDLPLDAVRFRAVDNANVVWIDHHKTIIEKFGDTVPGVRMDGVAACRLAWQWFMRNTSAEMPPFPSVEDFDKGCVMEPRALYLAGMYDVWKFASDHELPFQFGLTAAGYEKPEDLLPFLQENGLKLVSDTVNSGFGAMRWQTAYAKQVCKDRGYMVEVSGLKFWCLASCHARNSMWFPEGAVPEEADALMCYRLDGSGLVKFSLYHKPGCEDLDLSEIAVAHKGGGHKGACGFEMEVMHAVSLRWVR